MRSIKTLVILAMTALDLAIMARGVRANQLVSDAVFCKMYLKNRGLFGAAVRAETLGKFLSVIRLDAFNRIRKRLDEMLQKLRGRIGAMLLEGFHEPPSGILVNRCIIGKISAPSPR